MGEKDRHVTKRCTVALWPGDYQRLEVLRAARGYRTLRETLTWLVGLGEQMVQEKSK